MDSPPGAPTGEAPQGEGVVELSDDRPCIRCSYNLRGLRTSGLCPECGTQVAVSLRGNLLQYASPEYRAAILSGLSLILNGILCLILIYVLAIGATIASQVYFGPGPDVESIVDAVAGLFALCAFGMMGVGYWRFTEPDPGFVGTERATRSRAVLRVSAMVLFVTFVAVEAMPGQSSAASAGSGLARQSYFLLNLILCVAFVVQFFATMQYTRWLARRIPDAAAIRRAGRGMWLIPILSLIVCAGWLIGLVMYWNLLHRMRLHLQAIRTTGTPAKLKGAIA